VEAAHRDAEFLHSFSGRMANEVVALQHTAQLENQPPARLLEKPVLAISAILFTSSDGILQPGSHPAAAIRTTSAAAAPSAHPHRLVGFLASFSVNPIPRVERRGDSSPAT
jgi:hypothetical protein